MSCNIYKSFQHFSTFGVKNRGICYFASIASVRTPCDLLGLSLIPKTAAGRRADAPTFKGVNLLYKLTEGRKVFPLYRKIFKNNSAPLRFGVWGCTNKENANANGGGCPMWELLFAINKNRRVDVRLLWFQKMRTDK